MDTRFSNTDIFERRSKEWNMDTIKNDVEELFKKIELVDGWKFNKIEWISNDSRNRKKEELNKHIYKTLKITLTELTKKGEDKKEHHYLIQIPTLIDDQFFYIGGLLKTPIFQLFDDPIVFRKSGKGVFLKFRSNVLSMLCTFVRKKFCCNLYTNTMKCSKNIPFDLLMVNTHTKDDFFKFVNTIENKSDNLIKIITSCETLWDNNTQEELLSKLGTYRISTITTDPIKKGKSIVFAMKQCLNVDKYTRNFTNTDSPLFDILLQLNKGLKKDTSLNNKRIRFSEYILAELVKSIFDMICVLNYNKNSKFKISQTILVDSCNVSSIIHHNFPHNPINEIASLMQCTLIGPNSFKKENVPNHLKNIDTSQLYKICPADTPDRDGCGVILNMVPGVEILDNGKFNKETLSNNVCSYPINFTPFMSNDDQTRLQMASSQAKQAILLDNAEKPFVKTGIENKYLEYSSFKRIAKDDGEVIFLDKNIIIVKYNNDKANVYKIGYRTLNQNGVDYLYTNLKEGDSFKKGDTLIQSKFIIDDDITLGRNLLTACMIYKGYNYEDAYVISESASKKFTSLHVHNLEFVIEPGQILLSLDDKKYLPIPEIGSEVKLGEVIAKLKNLHQDGFESINISPTEIVSPVDGVIDNIEIYTNTRNKQVPQFNEFIEKHIFDQTEKIKSLKTKLKEFMSQSDIDTFMEVNELSKLEIDETKENNFVQKGMSFKGILIKVQIIYKESANVGDKLSNKHANKGVVGIIQKDELMPRTEDGRIIEMVINPLGIISRMNAGQLYELNCGEALYQFKEKLKTINKSDSINLLKEFISMFDNTEDKWITKTTVNKFEKEYKKNYIKAIDNIQIIQPPFQSIKPKQLFKIMEYTNAKFKHKIFDPLIDKWIKNEIAVGYMYFNKLVHRSSSKLNARSVGNYSKTTLLPSNEKKGHRAHRLGEMEVWALAGHGCTTAIKEMLTTHADASAKKNKMLANLLGNYDIEYTQESEDKPRTLQLLDSYLKVLGINLEK